MFCKQNYCFFQGYNTLALRTCPSGNSRGSSKAASCCNLAQQQQSGSTGSSTAPHYQVKNEALLANKIRQILTDLKASSNGNLAAQPPQSQLQPVTTNSSTLPQQQHQLSNSRPQLYNQLSRLNFSDSCPESAKDILLRAQSNSQKLPHSLWDSLR